MVLGLEALGGPNVSVSSVRICSLIGNMFASVLASVMLIVRMLFETSYVQIITGRGTKPTIARLSFLANSDAKTAPSSFLESKVKLASCAALPQKH